MRTKVTLVLIFLNVALFFFIFKFERHWVIAEKADGTRRRVLGPESADIRSLTLTQPGSNTVIGLSRERDTWSLTRPLDWPANQHAASSIINELQSLEHLATFTVADAVKNQQSLADYGLEKPRLVVEFTSGDPAASGAPPRPATRLQIGDTTPDGKRLYVLSPDGQRVHVVNRSLLDRLSLPLEQLRADTLLTIRVFEARSLSVQAAADPARGGAGLRIRVLRESGGQRWRFAAPHTAPAGKTQLELAINGLNALQAKTFNPTPPPSVPPSSAPALRVTLEGNSRQETLYFGEPVAGAAKDAAAVELHAQLEGRPGVHFTVVVPTPLLESLRHAQEALREKRFLEFDPAAVTSVTIASPLQSNQPPVMLQRLEAPAGQPRDAEQAWQVVHRSEGAQAPQTLPAEAASVRNLLQRLALLSAESFKSDAPTSSDLEEWGFNRPVREVTLGFGGGAAPVVLRIGSDAARSVYYARVGTTTEPGSSIYTVSPEIVNELPVAPVAWRARSIGEPLPPAARIAAVKLTDLAENRVLAEHTLNPAGEANPPPQSPPALATVVAALRNLRAKEFAPGGFAEKVFAAGEDRPWRFQLEATIAFPGAAQELTRPLTLLLTERLGGTQQFAGVKELDAVFALEQPLVDALWTLAYGARDPGPPAPKN